jgi:hypothetical protein
VTGNACGIARSPKPFCADLTEGGASEPSPIRVSG